MASALLSLALILVIAAALLAAGGVLAMALMLLRPERMTDGKAAFVLKRLSPGDLQLSFEDLRFKVRDEQTGQPLELAAWWIPHPNARGKTVVLIHGYSDAKVGAIAWAPTWHSLSFNILAIDLRAHGESGGRYSTAGFFERHDLNQLLDQFLAQRPNEARTLVLFGVSLGAAVALSTAAIRESDDIHAIVLDCPFADFRHAALQHAKMMNTPAPMLHPLAIRLAQWISGARFADVRPVDMLEKIRCPVMIIESCEDCYVPEGDKAALKEAMARRDPARSTYLRIDETGHVTGICADPDFYRTQIEAFLKSAEGIDHAALRIDWQNSTSVRHDE